MGAQDFCSTAWGETPEAAFREARDQAGFEHGHGYSGSLAEKHDFVLLTRTFKTSQDAYAFIRHEIGQNDKWGPAWALRLPDPPAVESYQEEIPQPVKRVVLSPGSPRPRVDAQYRAGQWGTWRHDLPSVLADAKAMAIQQRSPIPIYAQGGRGNPILAVATPIIPPGRLVTKKRTRYHYVFFGMASS